MNNATNDRMKRKKIKWDQLDHSRVIDTNQNLQCRRYENVDSLLKSNETMYYCLYYSCML